MLAHPDGGLQEVPWHLLAHRNGDDAKHCRKTNPSARLYLKRDQQTGKLRLRCAACRAAANFTPGQPLPNGQYSRRQPWQQRETTNATPSKQDFLILEVNDPRLYLPRVQSALALIPPESQVDRGSVRDRLYRNSAARRELDGCCNAQHRRSVLRRLSDELGCPTAALEDALKEIKAGWPLYGQGTKRGQLPEKEYHALTVSIPDQREGWDFVTKDHTSAWRTLSAADGIASNRVRSIHSVVGQLVAVTRLREIRIFRGFSRIEPHYDDGMQPNLGDGSSDSGSGWMPPDLDNSQPWLPAIELYGEGIFFTLDDALLRRWERQDALVRRAETLDQRLRRAGIRLMTEPPSPLPPRFILLHTLAHLLIRRLEAEAGYPAASIRERIYSAGGDAPMTGILVHVAVPDLAGSLGGLAELAEPTRFLRLLAGVFDHADWCSLDPVCAEHEGQGPSQLNRAACHACTLLPEPSCQFGNLLLDRVFVAGDLGGEIRSLLDVVGEG